MSDTLQEFGASFKFGTVSAIDAKVCRVRVRLRDYDNLRKRTVGDFLRDARTRGLQATLDDRKAWGAMRMSPTDLMAAAHPSRSELPALNVTLLRSNMVEAVDLPMPIDPVSPRMNGRLSAAPGCLRRLMPSAARAIHRGCPPAPAWF